ncbi:MAG TPA: glycosyltransferase family 39 protein [Candidatus Methanoperedens sp.]|nr:glycosyltransferase family 39 protein [Candidatus Methanoperedens sp.]
MVPADREKAGDEEGSGPPLPLILAATCLFPLLAALRHLDDNSLTSWAWVLEGRDLVALWALHLSVVAAALALCRRSLPPRARLLAAVLAAFIAGVALSGEPEAIVDASRYFVEAKYLALNGVRAFLREWGGELPAWTDLPLPGFLYGALFSLAGERRLGPQLLTAGLFALTAYATARIGRLLWGPSTGGRAASLLLAIPCLLVNVPLLMADVPAMAAVTVALWALLAVLSGDGPWRVPAAALALAAALLMKYSTWVLLGAACGAVLLIEAPGRGRTAAARGALALALGALAPALFALAKPELVQRQLALLAGFQWEGLRRWVESYPSTFLFQAHPLLAAAALAALRRGWRERDRRVLVAAAVPLVLFALGARRTRYLLPAFPMIALLAARGLEALPGRTRRFAVLSAVGFSLVTVFAVQLPFLQWVNTANLRDAGRFLDGCGVRAAAVAVLPTPGVPLNPEIAVPLLDYHTAALVIALGPPPEPPPVAELRASSFRFSWEGPLPAWYRPGTAPGSDTAFVLVSGDADAAPPPVLAEHVAGRAPDAVFARDAVFRFRTLVSVWLP